MRTEKIHKLLLSPITWGVVGLTIAAITFSGMVSMNISYILLFSAFLVGCFGIFRTGKRILISIIFCLLLGAGLALVLYLINDHQQRQITQNIVKPPTLRELFETDFPKTLKFSSDTEIHTRYDDTIVKIVEREYLDFESKSKFMGFYIPRSIHSYEVCEYLAGEYRNIMKRMDLVKVKGGGMPTDSAQTSSDDLTFSGRIYIYHEDDLSLQQLAALERLYNSKGLSVIFRSHAYMTLRWLGDKK
jgi:hypothetical protein